ncbi:MAG: BatD family protein [Bacteroidales bacterium]|nr:BatD family protein [Bacteroidales bacterium]
MKRTLLILLVLISTRLFAQEIIIHAPSSIAAGQRFQVRFEINDKASNFQGPSFKGLSVLSGPNQSTSTSMSWINGQTTRSVNHTFSYLIMADQPGSVTVGSASCDVNGKRITSKPFTIKVEKGDPNANQNAYGGSRNPQQQAQPQATTIDNNSLYAKASVNKTNPYLGEEIIITYKIYTQVSLQQYQIDKLPGNKGFWSEDLSEGKQIQQREEVINGKRYLVAEIRRGALFGQETGSQKIAPLQMEVLAMVPVQRRRTGTIWDLFDDPFFNQAQAVKKELHTNALSINVRPLPASPDGFSGGVGSFSAKSAIDQNEVKANEAITYSITINGHGNLMLIEAPEIDFPKVFEVYEPKITDKISRSDNGVSGSRTFEWVLIPQSQGSYDIPAGQFIYFNPAAGRYETITTEGFNVKVAKGNATDRTVSTSKSDVKKLNDDINHIKASAGRIERDSKPGLIYCIMVMAILLLLALTLYLGRRHQEFLQDEVGVRQSRALKQARKRLRNAEKHLGAGNDSLFFEEIYKALWGCLSDKYRIPLSQLSRETIAATLADHHIPEEKLTLIMETLENVDEARFAPGDSSARKQEIFNQTLNTIASL